MPLGDAQVRMVETMKWNKDLMNVQPSDATIENIVDVITTMRMTHGGHATPINPHADYPAGNVPAHRTAENFYKKWCDTIHAEGKKVLHRGTLLGIEGIWGHVKQVGGNRYPAGSYDSVIAPVFSDVFNRASVGPDWQTGHQVGNDWFISGGELEGPAPDGWRRTCLTTRVYTNFTVVARLKKIGNQQIVVRATTNPNFPGYGFQLRGGEFRLERPGLSQLASTPKTFTELAYYKVKVTCSGTSIKGKVWLATDPEPTTGGGSGNNNGWDIEVTHSEFASGYIGFSGESNFGRFDDITITPVADYNSHLGKIHQWIINNPTCFEDGDIWAPLPERTENIFQDSTSFLPHSAPGIQQNYANFFIDLKRVSEAAFASIGKPGVLCGYTANNFTEVRSGWIPSYYFQAMPCIAIDHYGSTHTVAEMESDLRALYAQYNKPIFLQEWGDYWNQAMEINARLAYIDQMYTMLGQLASEGILKGFGYWGAWTGTQEGILQGTAPTLTLNSRGQKLADHFAQFTTPGDTTPPTVSITSPANGATVSGNISVQANASDAVGVAGVQFKLDGQNLGAEQTVAPYQVSWNTAGFSNGSHALTAVGRDAAGNVGISSTVNVTVNNVVVPPPSPVWAKKYPRRGRVWTKKY